ncbi:putative phosphatidylethanolamine N-methyltransferase [Rosellinia necatrix]|uniref:Phosphatidylethanolamine N-methyltransferase n=1 Tax=Rosellinia necatrix TaxID=77044 RepID=A0A1S7UH90_ROSNE|nr:putative phosphatidylethanolamine N-methyltransferase [Rosellinia necatrix]
MGPSSDNPAAELRRRQVGDEDGSDSPHGHAGNKEPSALGGDKGSTKPPKQETTKQDTPKTYGRTRGGQVFVVPVTHDRIPQMLDPRQPKNVGDIVVLAVLAAHILALYALPSPQSKYVFAAVYLFWRAAYNVGIGVLLRWQSNDNTLVAWAQKWRLFELPSTGENPRPWLYNLLKRESETEIHSEFDFDSAPIEYNTWLVFRRFVDLILLCDFVSYGLFAIACTHTPVGEPVPMTIGRWLLGMAIVGFNFWVKLDALRVVKDYAWYWGDFFFLVDQELTFDGVFEMAPHPMYSIGYAGYYGISMMAGSYAVLFISILAHACQFAFLVLVENPHIEKTYNPPAPRKRVESEEENRPSSRSTSTSQDPLDSSPAPQQPSPKDIHNLLGLQNIDLFRNTDYSTCLLVLYLVILALVTPQGPVWQFLFVVHALIWRIWYSIGLGSILHRQSEDKMWTRHFLKFGDTTNEAWRQWKGMYHISHVLCYASFIAACWKMYSVPVDWNYGFVLLRHVIGSSLIALQIWTAMSIYESLGEFGWFFGDFFFDRGVKLNYTSIYRFLNNPERIIGTAGLWGAALITWSKAVFILAWISHVLTIVFLEFVEQPHMRKVYGENLRDEAGLTRVIKRALPPYVVEWQSSVNQFMDQTSRVVEELLDAARPKLVAGVSTIVRDTTALFNKYPTRLGIPKYTSDLAACYSKHYSVTVEGENSSGSALTERSSGKEGTAGRFPNYLNTLIFEYGSPIKVKWTAPSNHGKKDWIGLYMVADNQSRDVTGVSSLGRWTPTIPGQYESTTADKGILVYDVPTNGPGSDEINLVKGEIIFSGDKLWWTQGVFEFRYHHNGNHNTMAISQPFEIHVARFEDEDVPAGIDPHASYQTAVETALLSVVQNCLDRDPDIAPSKPTEPWGSHVERDGKYAKRIVYAIRQMFGIEFAAAVVSADGNVRNLAWRICNAKQVLAPYSMSSSKGTTTPGG